MLRQLHVQPPLQGRFDQIRHEPAIAELFDRFRGRQLRQGLWCLAQLVSIRHNHQCHSFK